MSALEQEIKTYNENLQSLTSQSGRFVVIKGSEIVGTYDTYADATQAGYERFGLEPFLVKKIAMAEQVSFFTRDFSLPCHA